MFFSMNHSKEEKKAIDCIECIGYVIEMLPEGESPLLKDLPN